MSTTDTGTVGSARGMTVAPDDGVADTARSADATTGAAEAVGFDGVAEAISEIAAGRPVVVVDDADRENEGDLIFAASKATPALLAFMIRHTSGVICVPMLAEELDRLQIPLMTTRNRDRMRTAFTVSVDAKDGITTGISAADRARTIRTLTDSATEPYELVQPGHIFPLRYRAGGVLSRRGHTEAAVDLARLAGLNEAGVLAEIVNDDGTMTRLPGLRAFAHEHGLKLISIAQLVEYRKRTERMVRRVIETRLPNRHGTWRVIGYSSALDGGEHLALVYGEVGVPETSTAAAPTWGGTLGTPEAVTAPGVEPGTAGPDSGAAAPDSGSNVLVRAHSECLTGDVLGSLRCDCGTQLEAAMSAIAAEGRGVVLYLRGHEGRGIGLLHKLRAYQLQDSGSDTVQANLELGLPADAREYDNAAHMLADLGVRSVRLLTNNPAKLRGLEAFGIEVLGRVSMPVEVTEHNRRYLAAKRDRLGHDIRGLDLA
jgi:3,4-dihydroxy 2-butanone 4-phosphate synthase/GTP cyclohydrolase II